jgi:hypothetical protein
MAWKIGGFFIKLIAFSVIGKILFGGCM